LTVEATYRQLMIQIIVLSLPQDSVYPFLDGIPLPLDP
jgi:hypothetical protein